MFYVKLMAMTVQSYVVNWYVVWTGSSLSDLSSETFDFFKKKYGIDNLALTCSYTYPDIQYYDEFNDFD